MSKLYRYAKVVVVYQMSGMSKYRLRPRNMSRSIGTTLFFINTDFELDYNMVDLNEKYHSKK